ncbi:hypothetical protein DYBT9275_01063 [Dyadobacter sp. CECT 9275]|uniref:DUF4905 domain-containing protein n=1 Tax=Dyadobacter helix TaxID=2822344 RepID=A0A916J947_9BACT|nr:DUF4905 domain-containing protein [Dyadobacter sp. CECT 9275]CAG4992897.1 hypothetical protein DYBT9275_01063 [Dyadobacter sp. CECT 9275]
MQKLFSFRFSQNIWRILPHPDPARNEWALELREISEKKVSFALIDLDKPAMIWQQEPEGTDWWTSLTSFSEGHIFLHNYRYPDIPEPTDLLCISVIDGHLSWALPNQVLVEHLGPGEEMVLMRSGEQLKYSGVNSNTGELFTLIERSERETITVNLKQPVRYKSGDMYFDQLSAFVKTAAGGAVPVSIDYLDQDPYMMFSYYIYAGEKFVQHLLIATKNREILFHEKISEPRDAVSLSTMLLKGRVLVYLKNNNEFSSLKLS